MRNISVLCKPSERNTQSTVMPDFQEELISPDKRGSKKRKKNMSLPDIEYGEYIFHASLVMGTCLSSNSFRPGYEARWTRAA